MNKIKLSLCKDKSCAVCAAHSLVNAGYGPAVLPPYDIRPLLHETPTKPLVDVSDKFRTQRFLSRIEREINENRVSRGAQPMLFDQHPDHWRI